MVLGSFEVDPEVQKNTLAALEVLSGVLPIRDEVR